MLTPRQVLRLAPAGAVLWFVFALLLGAVPGLLDGSARNALAFAAAVPVAWVLVRGLERLADLRGTAIVPGVALALLVALLLDGVAVTWFDGLYGGHARLAAAYILWGSGLILAGGLLRAGVLGTTSTPAVADGKGPDPRGTARESGA